MIMNTFKISLKDQKSHNSENQKFKLATLFNAIFFTFPKIVKANGSQGNLIWIDVKLYFC